MQSTNHTGSKLETVPSNSAVCTFYRNGTQREALLSALQASNNETHIVVDLEAAGHLRFRYMLLRIEQKNFLFSL